MINIKQDPSSKDDETSRYARDMAILEAATPGLWLRKTEYTRNLIELEDGEVIAIVGLDENAAFFKHFNPQYVRELLERIQQLEGGLQNAMYALKAAGNHFGEGSPDVYEDIEDIKGLLE